RPSSLPSDVEFVRGNPFNRDDLIRAGVDKASIVIILPFDEQDPVTSDAKVALLVMSVRGLNRDSYIIAEVLNQGNVGYVLNAGANSVVSLGSFTTTVIAKEIFDRGTSSALMNLIRRIDIMDSKDFIGLRFGDALERLRISGRGILIGVVRGGDVLINPGNNYTIQSGDSLLVVS
ncbi:MAG: NAD-binding protein, partial [Vulcanisaeta sp.]|nr:NAD-binding protein [Vulcanisaeta sp.]